MNSMLPRPRNEVQAIRNLILVQSSRGPKTPPELAGLAVLSTEEAGKRLPGRAQADRGQRGKAAGTNPQTVDALFQVNMAKLPELWLDSGTATVGLATGPLGHILGIRLA
jgi:hypothetical protein